MITEDDYLNQLEELSTLDDDQVNKIGQKLIQEIVQIAQKYQGRGLHWSGIKLLNRARRIIAQSSVLDLVLANCIGGRVELILEWTDQLGVAPPPNLLISIESDVRKALELDAHNSNLSWDLAVLQARFQGKYESASKNLDIAISLGYQHPMMSRLQALIQAAPPLSKSPPSSETQLRQLILQLSVQATGPEAWQLSEAPDRLRADDRESELGNLNSMEDYLLNAKKIIKEGNFQEDHLLTLMDDCQRIFSGDAAEAIADLIRRISEITIGSTFLNRATNWHLHLLQSMAFQLFPEQIEDLAAIRRSLRAANNGLDIIKNSGADIDPENHADLLIAKGQALYYYQPPVPAEAIRCYHKALILKQQANNIPEVEQLQKKLREQIDHWSGRSVISTFIGGFGESIEVLEACVEVAKDLEDPTSVLRMKLELAGVKRIVGQFDDAEIILKSVLDASPPEDLALNTKVELAAVYSETHRPADGAAIQKDLLDSVLGNKPMLWSHYANSLMLLNQTDEALTALDKAWNLLPPDQKQKIGDTVPKEGAHIHAQKAQVFHKQGNLEAALEEITTAFRLEEHTYGIDGLHLLRIQASVFFELERFEEAIECLDRALHNLAFLLRHGPSLSTWESMLRQWSDLNEKIVRAILQSQLENRHQKGFLRAEAAKGIVYAWLENWLDPQSAEQVLSLERQEKALEIAQQWLVAREDRELISLYASPHGLGIFNLNSSGNISEKWLDDFNYDRFRQDLYEPWEKLSERALSEPVEQDFFTLVNAQTDYLLDLVGTWLWRANPQLTEGGSDLVIIPHRAFRSLPLLHARLPTGKRLSDLFETVTVLPSLSSINRISTTIDEAIESTSITTLADADDTLTFARCEALLAGEDHNIFVGENCTIEALKEALSSDGASLISLHGDFDETNPYRSRIFASNGEIELYSFMAGQEQINNKVVILGVCEGGRTRRSVSDEPFGFPAIFLQGGADVVLAPTWRVDDFISFLYMTKLFEEVKNGTNIYLASLIAVKWLAGLTIQEVLDRIDILVERVRDAADREGVQIDEFEQQISEQKGWLKKQELDSLAFRFVLDWSAFQLTGLLPT